MCLVVAPRPFAAPSARFERLVARALDPADVHAYPDPVDIVIEHWSTDGESDALNNMLTQAGPDKLIAALSRPRPRAGVIEFPGVQATGARARGRQSQVFQFARDIKTAKGRQIIVAMIEPVRLGEHPTIRDLANDTRPKSAFTLIDIRFGADGKGIGKLADAAKVVYNKKTGTIELANYDQEPVRLTGVKSELFNGGFAREAGK
jgi:hypothetical protein